MYVFDFRFDSSTSPLIYADQFIKFSSRLSSPFLYGLGEHRQPLLINVTNQWMKLTFWTRDHYPLEGVNLYGKYSFHDLYSIIVGHQVFIHFTSMWK